MTLRLVPTLLLVSAGLCSAQRPPIDKPVPASQPRPSAATVKQWQDRKFGMFIHFGLFSTFGGTYRGKPIDNGYSEQIMANAPVPLEEYAAAAKSFNPVKWDPDAVVALAKAAGMKYIVITSKHHDGFNMFATKQTTYNIVDGTPYHRDVVKELAEACRRGGLAFGVYYSSIDWHQPGMDHYIEGNSNELSDAHAQFNAAQLRELMTHYGPISEIWFDMGKPTPEQSRLFATTVHTLQPQAMVSGRVWNYQGDFTVMGDNEVPRYGIDEPWQTPASIFADTWGYRSWEKRTDLEGKIEENILKLVQVVSRGGNYILNIGPEGDGSIVPYEADVLKGVGAWLRTNGEAIYGTQASPLAGLDFGYVTLKGSDVYLILKTPVTQLRLPGTGRTRWKQATLLNGGGSAEIHTDAAGTTITLPGGTLAGFLPVVKLTTAGGLIVDPELARPGSNGSIVLTEAHAEKFYNYNGRGYEAPRTLYKLRWHVPQGCYNVTLHGKGTGAVSLGSAERSRVIDAAEGSVQHLAVGVDNTVEITPPQPFTKGTALAFTPEVVVANPCSRGSR